MMVCLLQQGVRKIKQQKIFRNAFRCMSNFNSLRPVAKANSIIDLVPQHQSFYKGHEPVFCGHQGSNLFCNSFHTLHKSTVLVHGLPDASASHVSWHCLFWALASDTECIERGSLQPSPNMPLLGLHHLENQILNAFTFFQIFICSSDSARFIDSMDRSFVGVKTKISLVGLVADFTHPGLATSSPGHVDQLHVPLRIVLPWHLLLTQHTHINIRVDPLQVIFLMARVTLKGAC